MSLDDYLFRGCSPGRNIARSVAVLVVAFVAGSGATVEVIVVAVFPVVVVVVVVDEFDVTVNVVESLKLSVVVFGGEKSFFAQLVE